MRYEIEVAHGDSAVDAFERADIHLARLEHIGEKVFRPDELTEIRRMRTHILGLMARVDARYAEARDRDRWGQ